MVPALRELRRCLAPGAPAVFMHLIAGSRPLSRRLQRFVTLGSGIVFPTLEATNRLFQEAGFTVARQECHNIVVFTHLQVEGAHASG